MGSQTVVIHSHPEYWHSTPSWLTWYKWLFLNTRFQIFYSLAGSKILQKDYYLKFWVNELNAMICEWRTCNQLIGYILLRRKSAFHFQTILNKMASSNTYSLVFGVKSFNLLLNLLHLVYLRFMHFGFCFIRSSGLSKDNGFVNTVKEIANCLSAILMLFIIYSVQNLHRV